MKIKKSKSIFFRGSYVSFVITVLAIILLTIASGCTKSGSTKSGSSGSKNLILATTTSVQDTGLLDYLLPMFEKKYDCKVKPIAVGSGEAIKMGQSGNADALLVHSPKDEKTFMENGFGIKRKTFMYNYFIIVGPKNDPAGISNIKDLKEALNTIADKGLFVSRGDDSGTNKKELKLWDSTGKKPQGKNYIVSGQGMGETLQIASEKQAYTITDKATFLALQNKLDLKVYFEGGKDLLNQYSVITVNYKKFKKINKDLANKFYNWITSKEILQVIGKYKQGKLFYPYN
jgi:tungstate transport system substrate-binding protein